MKFFNIVLYTFLSITSAQMLRQGCEPSSNGFWYNRCKTTDIQINTNTTDNIIPDIQIKTNTTSVSIINDTISVNVDNKH